MINQLHLWNFKSWADTGDIRLAPLTGLFGTNSSGKTSLLQSLLMLKQTADSPDRAQVLNLGDDRSLVDLGTFQEVMFAHDLTKFLEWFMQWSLPQPLIVDDPSRKKSEIFSGKDIGFSARVGWKTNGNKELGRAIVERMTYQFAGVDFEMKLDGDKSTEYTLFANTPEFRFVRTQGRPWKLPPPAKCYGFPDQVRAYYQNAGFLSDLELEFEQLFSRLFYLGPLREYPRRQYPWAGSQPADMGRRGERVVEALLASREAGIKYSLGRGTKRQTLEERVAHWLKELGLIANFEVRPIAAGGKLFQVWVRKHSKSAEVLITDVGFGVSQILPVITLCYYVPEGSIVLLEQPEIHLHPSVQAGLADVLIDAIKTRHIQIILESHSEHLLRRLQRRIAEEVLSNKEVALYFCETGTTGSILTPLQVDLVGTISNWPTDFFGDQFGELAAAQEARVRRMSTRA